MSKASKFELCGMYTYLAPGKNSISHLSIEDTNLFHICEDMLSRIISSNSLKSISFRNNKLRRLSAKWKTMENNVLESLYIAGNPVECKCEMLWMANWLENTTSSKGMRLVPDYKDVICASGAEIGKPVYMVDPITMGCYPERTKTWIVVVSSTIAGLILTITTILILIHHCWKLVRWLIYKNFDKLVGDPDRNEDITDITFDAFLSFR